LNILFLLLFDSAFGETSLVTSKPRGGTILCIRQKAELLRLNRSDFNEILRNMSDQVDFQTSSTRDVIVRAKRRNFELLGSVRIIRNVTRGIPEFDAMEEKELHSLLEKLSVRYYESGEELYAKYSKARECYMLLDGSVTMKDHNGESMYEIQSRGKSFGMMGLLERQSRAMSVVCDNDDGCICLVIDSETYHKYWKGKMDRHFSTIIGTLKKAQSLGSKDSKELDMVATFAVPVQLPRGAILRLGEVSPKEQHHHSVLYVVSGECELKMQKSSKNDNNNNYSHDAMPLHGTATTATTITTFNAVRPSSSSGKRRPTSARSKRGVLSSSTEEIGPAALVGPGMVLGNIFKGYSGSEDDDNDGRHTSHSHHHRGHHRHHSSSNSNHCTLKCTRPTILIRLRTHYLHHCLKPDTLHHLRLCTTSHLKWLQNQTTTMDKIQQMQAVEKLARLPQCQIMPGMSDQERETHEARLRTEKFAKRMKQAQDAVFSSGINSKDKSQRRRTRPTSASLASRSESPFEAVQMNNDINGSTILETSRKHQTRNVFSEQDTRVVAMHIMHKVDKILNGGKNKTNGWRLPSNAGSAVGISAGSGHVAATSSFNATASLKPSLKQRWTDMKKGLKNAKKNSKAINHKRKKNEHRIDGSEREVRSLLERHAATVNCITEMPSEMIPMRTQTYDRTGRSEGGRILSLGTHRSTYLSSIFAQLGRSGIVSTQKHNTTMKMSMPTPQGGEKGEKGEKGTKKRRNRRGRRKKFKNATRGQIVIFAIDRREKKNKKELTQAPKQMFDSLNYNRFV
jgi:CRP-like cAMP-binding protein